MYYILTNLTPVKKHKPKITKEKTTNLKKIIDNLDDIMYNNIHVVVWCGIYT